MSISLIQHSGTLVTYGKDRSAEGAADQAPQQRTTDAALAFAGTDNSHIVRREDRVQGMPFGT
jgi:hypothetical protein